MVPRGAQLDQYANVDRFMVGCLSTSNEFSPHGKTLIACTGRSHATRNVLYKTTHLRWKELGEECIDDSAAYSAEPSCACAILNEILHELSAVLDDAIKHVLAQNMSCGNCCIQRLCPGTS